MRDAPSAELIELLAHLRLATPEQVREVRRYAQSLARDLPLFDSVWVDALMRRRLLTPFQAAEINAGRGADLEVGPAILYHPPERLGYADQYLAQMKESGEQVRVIVARLTQTVSELRPNEELTLIAEQLQRAQQAEIAHGVAPIVDSGVMGNRLWIVQPYQHDISLREWLLRHGRLPAEYVLEIARQMSAELEALERFSLVHGDISSASIRITEAGNISVAFLGLRSVVRPGEGYAHADLSPEAYDYLAPERISAGTTANVSSDLYACGCLWWQLLTGRAPLAGGDSLTKIKAAHASRIAPLERYAPETPPLLMAAINRLVHADPHARGASFSELAAELGPASTEVQLRLADCHRKLHPWMAAKPVAKTGEKLTSKQPSRQNKQLMLPRLLLWFLSNRMVPSFFGRRALITFAITCCAMLALVTWIFWPVGSRTGRENEAQVVEQGPAQPGILATSQVEQANLISSTPREANGQQAFAARVASNTATSQEVVVTAGHEVAEQPEDPIRSMKVVRQVLPIRETVLPSDRIVQASTLELHPGMRLAPAAGSRARVEVPAGGWQIDVDEVRLENIDFVLPATTDAESIPTCFVSLKANSAQFHGCAFRLPEDGATVSPRLSAIDWVGSDSTDSIDRLPEAGQLLLANCVLANLYTGVDCQLTGPVVLELDNVLFSAPKEAANSGALWKIDHAPASEDAIVMRMNACTVRDAMSLVDLYCSELPSDPGKIKFETIDCVFSLRSTGALLRMIGPYRPDRLMRSVAWSGRGSLLPVQGRFGLWYDAQGAPHKIDDSDVQIDGLVRGGVEFAGPGTSHPHDSVLTHWAAPLIGDARPGVRVSALPSESRN